MKSTGHKLELGPPVEPLHDLISSERYIDSLERRLNKVKGNQAKEPTAKEMLSALEKTKEGQMHQLLDSNTQHSSSQDPCLDGAVVNKTHTGKQQNLEEIVALIYQDALSKDKEDTETDKG
ncbi:uncharacterized protein LOC134709406 [Mytilus trossulus]|uniref:uncharacterized protein LOC134709406 n=1 Tax=Mytilus trossulus TaxID=6551 RepID=UPI00300571C0